MSSRVFITLSQEVMTELVRKAERRVFYAAPGIIRLGGGSVSEFLGPENCFETDNPGVGLSIASTAFVSTNGSDLRVTKRILPWNCVQFLRVDCVRTRKVHHSRFLGARRSPAVYLVEHATAQVLIVGLIRRLGPRTGE